MAAAIEAPGLLEVSPHGMQHAEDRQEAGLRDAVQADGVEKPSHRSSASETGIGDSRAACEYAMAARAASRVSPDRPAMSTTRLAASAASSSAPDVPWITQRSRHARASPAVVACRFEERRSCRRPRAARVAMSPIEPDVAKDSWWRTSASRAARRGSAMNVAPALAWSSAADGRLELALFDLRFGQLGEQLDPGRRSSSGSTFVLRRSRLTAAGMSPRASARWPAEASLFAARCADRAPASSSGPSSTR